LFSNSGSATATADKGPHPGAQLLVADWLHDIVVSAGVEASHYGIAVGATGVEKHRRPATVSAELLQNLEAVPVSQLEIEHDAVVLVDEGKHPRFLSGACGVHGVAVIAQNAGDQLQDRAIVINCQNAHSKWIES
jgi:hypothetical protein